MKKMRLTAAALLIFSCFSHFGEALVFEPKHAYGSMIFGLIYFVLGIMLFMKHPKAYWSCAIIPSIGFIAALFILIQGEFNFLLPVHMAIDVFVVYVAIKYVKKYNSLKTQNSH